LPEAGSDRRHLTSPVQESKRHDRQPPFAASVHGAGLSVLADDVSREGVSSEGLIPLLPSTGIG
jgi:hypothetical protein